MTPSHTSEMQKTHDVLCIGNAIVDILAQVDDGWLEAQNCPKGAMNLVDAERSAALYAALPPATERSGGSAGNTAVGIASFGGSVRYIGKVHDDQMGASFRGDMRAVGVDYDTGPTTSGLPTATSMIAITPDSERTMNTFLGACVDLSEDDIVEAHVAGAAITYIEGYLWDSPSMKAAVTRAIDLAKAHGNRVALSLSDSFCVDRFKAEFRDLVEGPVDILFANQDEIMALYDVEDDYVHALDAVQRQVTLAAITRSEHGSILVTPDERIVVPAASAKVVDTTGAGDLYAAGVLYGLGRGLPLATCGAYGSAAAAAVIGGIGARPDIQLSTLITG